MQAPAGVLFANQSRDDLIRNYDTNPAAKPHRVERPGAATTRRTSTPTIASAPTGPFPAFKSRRLRRPIPVASQRPRVEKAGKSKEVRCSPAKTTAKDLRKPRGGTPTRHYEGSAWQTTRADGSSYFLNPNVILLIKSCRNCSTSDAEVGYRRSDAHREPGSHSAYSSVHTRQTRLHGDGIPAVDDVLMNDRIAAALDMVHLRAGVYFWLSRVVKPLSYKCVSKKADAAPVLVEAEVERRCGVLLRHATSLVRRRVRPAHRSCAAITSCSPSRSNGRGARR
jgi:hypothetical protein